MNIKADKISSILIKAFIILVLLLAADALFPLLGPPDSARVDRSTRDHAQGNALIQTTWLGIYGVVILLIFPWLKKFAYVVTRDKLLLLLVVIVVVSILWSAAPDVTLRRTVAFVGTTLFGAYLAMRYSPAELLRLLALALGIAAVLSVIVALVLPSYGVTSDSSRGVAWTGIFAGSVPGSV